MKKKEIGSEFSNYEKGLGFEMLDGVVDYTFTFSGRTAIEVILNNLKNKKKAILPSYCCDSMIAPFRDANIDICFYDINYINGFQINIDIPDDVDLLLWCNYFGYKTTMPNMDYFIERGGIIIEDITHSVYSSKKYDSQSHFVIASLRKWGALFSGGYCASLKSRLRIKPLNTPPKSFIDKKKKAMKLKEKYLRGSHDVEKDYYLSLFNECNNWLSQYYNNLAIDEESKKIILSGSYEFEKARRIKNAKYLHKGLKNCVDIDVLLSEGDMDCPIFVPVIIKNGKRDYYRKKLIDNNVYCPIHWPRPNEKCKSNLYDIELSIICDQRYSEEDMAFIIKILCEEI